VDPIPGPLRLRKSGIEPGTSETVARGSDHWTTEAAILTVPFLFAYFDLEARLSGSVCVRTRSSASFYSQKPQEALNLLDTEERY
jgi:hypothetical protein